MKLHIQLIAGSFFISMPFAGLGADKAPATESTNEGTTAKESAREVNRYEFIELELVTHPEDEKQFNHYYMGSRDGFDYISVRKHRYKIPSDQLKLEKKTGLTEDVAKWIPMRIHFSHVKYQQEGRK